MCANKLDYSKWDKLDISDDEKDYHPNIDASLMIRIKREQRERREAEEAKRIEELKKSGRLEDLAEIHNIEKNKKLHVGNICRVVDEKTIINKTKNEPIKNEVMKEDNTGENLSNYIEQYEDILTDYSEIEELEDTEKFIYDHSEILSENACGHLLLRQLDLEMKGKTAKMIHCVRQYIILRNILDLGKEARKKDGDDLRPMVKLFFKQVLSDSKKKGALKTESLNFAEKIKMRAIEKQKELNEQCEDEEFDDADDEEEAVMAERLTEDPE